MSFSPVPARTKVTAIATAFALAVTTVSPAANAQPNPITIPRVAVGATATDMHFSWRTSYRGAEQLKLWVEGQDPVIFDAREKDYVVPGRAMHAQAHDLQPGVTYSYQVGSDEGGWSEPATFTTQAAGDSWKYLAFADAQIGVDLKVTEQANNWRTAVSNATTNYPDANFLLHSGDQVEGWGVPSQQWAEFFSPEQMRSYPVALAKGNHETYTKVEGPINFRENINFPNVAGDYDTSYFFERNNALFIVLDSNENDQAAIQKHANFVRETKKNHGEGKDWTIVVMHHAPYSHGGRYNTDDRVTRLREGLSPVFSEVGVDLVMTGHDHMYNRTHLMSGTTPRKLDAAPQAGDVLQAQDGEVVYVTTSTAGGGKFYDFHDVNGNKRTDITTCKELEDGLQIPAVAVCNQDYTTDYAAVEISPNKLTMRTHNVSDNSVVDEFTIERDHPNQGKAPEETPGEDTNVGDGNSDSGDNGDNKDGSADGSSLSSGAILGLSLGVIVALIGGVALASPQLREFAEQFGIRF